MTEAKATTKKPSSDRPAERGISEMYASTKVLATALTTLIGLMTAANAVVQSTPHHRGANPDLPVEMHEAITASFVDPTSAQYEGLSTHTDASTGAEIVCGWVAARNLVGGLTPPYPFYYRGDTGEVRIDESYAGGVVTNRAWLARSGCPAATPIGLRAWRVQTLISDLSGVRARWDQFAHGLVIPPRGLRTSGQAGSPSEVVLDPP